MGVLPQLLQFSNDLCERNGILTAREDFCQMFLEIIGGALSIFALNTNAEAIRLEELTVHNAARQVNAGLN